ncbi:MAG TPA: Xaa-Pro peptidase family protein [Gaiellaceae bacterium]|nr:Xaa-Pro peptidase family protein [Gaiellaceae bacterium]
MSTTASAVGAQVLERVRGALGDAGLDAVVATSREALIYTAGAAPPSLRTVRQRLAASIVPATGETEAVVVSVDAQLMRERMWADRVTAYVEFEQHPMQAAAAALQRAGLDGGRLGVELTALSVEAHDVLRRSLPNAELVPVDELLAGLRVVKTPAEIDAIRRIGRAAEEIAARACRSVGAGDTERDLGNAISEAFAAAGGDELTMLVVGAGERSSHPNAPPTSRTLQAGDVVRLDVIGTSGGYHCDVARTAVVGEPREEVVRVYELLESVHERALEAVRPGVQSAEVYRIYRDAMEAAELPPYHFVGHGLGITLHEEPFVHAQTSVPLEPGMVLCIEPLTMIEGEFGVQIEDELVVTDDGCELITRASGLLPIGT